MTLLHPITDAHAPIGIFDSGIGGLSVLRHIRACLPRENVLYVADSGFAPYGGKPEAVIVARALLIAAFLLERGAKALVLACNTATAAAIKTLRDVYPELIVVGVEPGLKPAAALTQTGTVGVLATSRTLASGKFEQLREQISAATHVRFVLQAGVGLADQIEKGELDTPETAALIKRYIEPLIEQGIDTLVLGCTHYPFVQNLIDACITGATDRRIAIVDTGEAVTRQLARLLAKHRLECAPLRAGALEAFTTASETALADAFSRLLKIQPRVTHIGLPHSLG